MHKVCHCSWGGGGEGEVLPGRKMNETEAIFSFCVFFLSKKKKKRKNSDRLEKTIERAE